MRGRRVSRVIAAVIVAAFFLPPLAWGGIKVVHPRSGSSLSPGEYLVIGSVEGASSGKVLVYSGKKKLTLAVENGVFYGKVPISSGKLTLLGPDGTKTTVSYRVSRKAAYREHLEEASCSDCHDKNMEVQFPEDLYCYSCHERKDKKEFVHGPIGGGACAICHDPHGSSRKFFLRAELREMCVACHDQESSRAHVEKKKNRTCNRCHDPHSSDNRFFLKKR
ncbi:MAG: hypothetical protein D6713_07935 [Deltaproteobacteria bacterium]|nr:MAG: hypothetical protein D6713_07935 [Deltaproteobacteria bacterium]